MSTTTTTTTTDHAPSTGKTPPTKPMASKRDIPTMSTVDVDALADRCLDLLRQSQKGNHAASNCGFNCYDQVFVGIAGTPGSGKSYIAERVREAVRRKNPNGDADVEECVVVGMDGYHLTREELKRKAEAGETFKTDQDEEDPDGDGEGGVAYKRFTYEELLARRGAGFTYNPQKFIEDLRRVKENGEGSFPVYDRDKQDPVPDGVHVHKHHKIILVEGLYLLCLHDPDWAPLDDLWDDKWYVDVSMEETRRRLIRRHLKYWDDSKTRRWGGDDAAAAARKAESNDLKNAACIRKMTRDQANLIVRNESVPENDEGNADVDAAAS